MRDRLEELRRMAYSAEWDGYDRNWHKVVAKSHTEMAALARGADQAKREITEESAPGPKSPA